MAWFWLQGWIRPRGIETRWSEAPVAGACVSQIYYKLDLRGCVDGLLSIEDVASRGSRSFEGPRGRGESIGRAV